MLLAIATLSSEYSGPLAISILTRFAEKSLSHLNNLEAINYSKQMIQIVLHSLSVDSRVFALFSLIPIFQVQDYTKTQRPLFEDIMHLVSFKSDYQDRIDYTVEYAVMYCCDAFVHTSPKCRSIAIQNGVIDFALYGLQTPRKSKGLSCQKVALEILMCFLSLKVPEYTDLILMKNIFQTI